MLAGVLSVESLTGYRISWYFTRKCREYNIVLRYDCAQTRLCPENIVPRHGCAQIRLCPDTFVSRHVCVQARLCPDKFVPRQVCAQTRLRPDTILPSHACAHIRLYPYTIVPLTHTIVLVRHCAHIWSSSFDCAQARLSSHSYNWEETRICPDIIIVLVTLYPRLSIDAVVPTLWELLVGS